MNLKKIILTVLILALSIGVIYGGRLLFGPNNVVTEDLKYNIDRSKGNSKADLWILEYFDFQCPSCRNASESLKTYIKLHPDRIYLQVRYFPLDGHPHGWAGAIWGECAWQQGKFWKFFDLLYERQEDWTSLTDVREKFEAYSKELKLNVDAMRACVEDPKTREKILKEKEEARTLGVQSTPTFFVNGTMLVGPKPIEDYLEGYFKDENK